MENTNEVMELNIETDEVATAVLDAIIEALALALEEKQNIAVQS